MQPVAYSTEPRAVLALGLLANPSCAVFFFPITSKSFTSSLTEFCHQCQKIAGPCISPTSYDLFLLPPPLITQLPHLSLPAPLALFHLGSQSCGPDKRVSPATQEPQACLEGERSSTSKCFHLVPDTSLTGGCLLINSQLP